MQQHIKAIEVGWKIRRRSKAQGKKKDNGNKAALPRQLTRQPACATTNR
jgi:hypothetical protein